jgi:hypothetical protein
MEDQISIVFPHPPQHGFKTLPSQSFPVGARLAHFIQTKLQVTIPPDFKDNCDTLDAIREQLRNTGELPPDRHELVSDYIHLLTTLTSGFDLSEQGAGLQFIWNGLSLYNIDFEICCLTFNLCVGLLNKCQRLEPTGTGLKELVATIKAAKSLIDKCEEHFSEDFSRSLTSSTISEVQLYVTAVFYQSQASVLIAANKRKLLAGGVKLAAVSFSKLHPEAPEYVKYYNIAAQLFRAEAYHTVQEYGNCIGDIRNVMKQIPQEPKVLKKMAEPFKTLYTKLLADFKPINEKWERENAKIYFEPIPKEIDDVAPMKANQVIGSFNWDKFITPVTPFESTINDSFEEKINERLNNFQTEASRALKDIDETIALLPKQLSMEAEAKHKKMMEIRNQANNIVQQISTIMNIKASQISQRCPQLFQQFNQSRSALQKAAETDLYYETQLAKSESLVDSLNVMGAKLEDLKCQITQIIRSAEIAAEEARKSTGMTATLQAMQTFKATLDDLAKQLNPIFAETVKTVKEVKNNAETSMQQFSADIASASKGFDNANAFYTKLVNNFNIILTNANNC